MVKFRLKQIREIGKVLATSFPGRVTAFVRAELPGAAGDVTQSEIEALIERARGYGFTLETTIVTFVLAARLLGDDFDDRLPDARAILEDKGPERMRALDLRLITITVLEQSSTDETRHDES
jgi:hypothetical protein